MRHERILAPANCRRQALELVWYFPSPWGSAYRRSFLKENFVSVGLGWICATELILMSSSAKRDPPWYPTLFAKPLFDSNLTRNTIEQSIDAWPICWFVRPCIWTDELFASRQLLLTYQPNEEINLHDINCIYEPKDLSPIQENCYSVKVPKPWNHLHMGNEW